MKTRIIHTKIWEDEWFTTLSKEGKLLFMYLISNQRINLCGMYEITDRVMLFESGLKSSELQKAKSEMSDKVIFYDGWVYVKNAKRHGGYKGEKNDIACGKEMAQIPKDIINGLNKGKVDRVSIGYGYPSDTTINHKSEIINQKSEAKEAEDEKIETLISYLGEYDDNENFICGIPKNDKDAFLRKYDLSESQLIAKAKSFYNYCKSKGVTYKNYKFAIRNAISKDFKERTQADLELQERIRATQLKNQGSSEFAKKLVNNFSVKK